MPQMGVYFTYHGIGQGMFYTGKIDFGNGEPAFNFVYDCGTSSRQQLLKNAITAYHANCSHSIDLLILSHFDDDHINGLDSLLKNTS